MSATDSAVADRPRPTVFLSYASEDRTAAQRIRDALPGFGLEVWYDESDLIGGDAWDQKIRGQIRACDYFMPVISSHTEARHEGYFRREWRLAAERTLDMADDHVFLLPVVIDGTLEAGARVPEKFRAVQWLRVPEGRPTAALEAVCRRLVCGESKKPPAWKAAAAPPMHPVTEAAAHSAPRASAGFPPFPREEPGQKVRFGLQAAGWMLQSTWAAFKRLPKWARLAAYVWLLFVIGTRGCTSAHDDHRPEVSDSAAQKLAELGAGHADRWTPADTAQLVSQLARELPAQTGAGTSAYAPLLAIPFATPSGNSAAQRLAGSVFAQLYGRLAIAHHGHVALAGAPLSSLDAAAALEQGRAHHSAHVIYGAVEGKPPHESLNIRIVGVEDGTIEWTRSYAVSGADPGRIAAQVSSEMSDLED
jgi:hypothetical protein